MKLYISNTASHTSAIHVTRGSQYIGSVVRATRTEAQRDKLARREQLTRAIIACKAPNHKGANQRQQNAAGQQMRILTSPDESRESERWHRSTQDVRWQRKSPGSTSPRAQSCLAQCCLAEKCFARRCLEVRCLAQTCLTETFPVERPLAENGCLAEMPSADVPIEVRCTEAPT